jgi:hypothetical protein
MASDSKVATVTSYPEGALPPERALARPRTAIVALLSRVFSFPVLLGVLLIAGVFGTGREFTIDPDSWWHIKTGEIILSTHRWPTTDPYSFTVAGQPWLSYEWGGDVVLAAAARLAGLQGLDAVLILLAAAVMIGLYCLATLCAGNSKAAFVASATLLALVVPSFNLRPQMLGYLFLILTLIALERFRQHKPTALWFLPLVFLVWINTHGSWIIGLGVVATYWLGGLLNFRAGGLEAVPWKPSERRRISFVFLLCLCALPVTPYGARLSTYPFEVALSTPVSKLSILEWQPMPFNQVGGKLFLGLLLAFLLAQVMARFTWRLEQLTLFVFGAAMATIHVRFVLLFVPFFAPLLATILARWIPAYDRQKDRYALNAVMIAAAIVGMIHYFPSQTDLWKKAAQSFPVKAVEYLDQHPVPEPMFNSYGFGGYLVWSRWPEHKVFIDGRSELYEYGGVLHDYMQVLDIRPPALAILRVYGIRSCLLDRDESLVTVLSALPEWQKVYSDNRSVLFVRRESASAGTAMLEKSPGKAVKQE